MNVPVVQVAGYSFKKELFSIILPVQRSWVTGRKERYRVGYFADLWLLLFWLFSILKAQYHAVKSSYDIPTGVSGKDQRRRKSPHMHSIITWRRAFLDVLNVRVEVPYRKSKVHNGYWHYITIILKGHFWHRNYRNEPSILKSRGWTEAPLVWKTHHNITKFCQLLHEHLQSSTYN